MAETKKKKSDDVMDCPLGHEKSVKYVSRDDLDKQPITVRRVVIRMPHAKIALCSKCGLILTFADEPKKEKIAVGD